MMKSKQCHQKMSKNLKNKEYKVQQHSIQIVFRISLKINFNQTKKSLTK